MTKILVIDDKKDNLITVKTLLKNLEPEYEVFTAENGIEGIKLAKSIQPDTILLDVHMPRIDGYEVCRRLRADKKTELIPIIFLTAARTSSKDRIKGLELGGDAYLTKPLDEGELLANLHAMLRIKKAEDSIIHRYEHIVSSSTDMMALIDKEFTYLAVNQAYVDVFQKTSDEVIGHSVSEIHGKEFFETVIKANAERCLSGEIINYQDWFDFPVFEKRFMDITYSPYIGEDKKIEGFVVSGRNITKLKQVEEERTDLLLDIDERLKELQCMYNMIESIQARDTLDEIFQDVTELIPPGWHYPEITKGKVIFDGKEYISDQFDESEWKQSSDLIINGETRGSIEVYYLEERPELDEGPFMVEERNLINAMAKNMSKTIERKLASEKLLETKQMLENITQGILEGIFLISKDFEILWANKATLEQTGYEMDEILGRPCYEVTHHRKSPCEAPLDSCPIYFLQKTGKLLTIEHTHFNKEGDEIFVEVSAYPIKDEKGEIVQFVHLCRDITERKQAENELKIALDEARSANKVKDQFLANMSHEIRTPLNTILGFTDLIEESTRKVIGEEERKFFKVISTSGERLMHTVHEILDISQIEAGTYVNKIEVFNLVPVVQELVDVMQLKAKEKQLKLEFHSTRKHTPVRADRDGIYQSLNNIIENAILYTEKGKITVNLRQKSKCAILTIQDTGIGMSQEYLDKLFEVFTQESEGYTKKYQGIGLGMSIVKRHLDLNQVNIVVNSTKGKGTTITLTFPNPHEISYEQVESKKD